MTIRAVFFDLGGTLLVMRRDRIFRKVINENGRDATLEAIHSVYMGLEPWWLSNYSSREMIPEETEEAYRHLDQTVLGSLFPDLPQDETFRISRLVRRRWPELEKEIPLELYPDVEPTLEELTRREYVLGLVSNAPADTGRVVRALGIDQYMSNVVISGAVGYTKPNPEIFRIALRRAGTRPDEAAHVGDVYEADVVGAGNAGMKGILLDRMNQMADHDCPRVSSLDQIFRYL